MGRCEESGVAKSWLPNLRGAGESLVERSVRDVMQIRVQGVSDEGAGRESEWQRRSGCQVGGGGMGRVLL